MDRKVVKRVILYSLLFAAIILGITGIFKGGYWLRLNNPNLYYFLGDVAGKALIVLFIIWLALWAAFMTMD